jgi:hypothetical protein
MPTLQDEFQAFKDLMESAIARAAIAVEAWIPEKVGDRIAGKVVELGSITTVYGEYATTTLEVFGDYVENGETKTAEGKLIRVAWMGAVLQAQYMRMRPDGDDLVAFHFQSLETPKSGMKDYPLIQAVVIDWTTRKAKRPVDPSVHVPSTEEVVNADPRTGEIVPGRSPLEPRDGEPPLTTPEEDAAAVAKAEAKRR